MERREGGIVLGCGKADSVLQIEIGYPQPPPARRQGVLADPGAS